MKKSLWISALFAVAALYDGLLGLVFLLAPLSPFQWYGVTPPNHVGYVQFPALLLIVFGLMFLAVARDPVGNRNLIPYGMMLKISYSGIVGYYWVTTGLPSLWKPFAVIDAVMLVLFVFAYVAMGRHTRS